MVSGSYFTAVTVGLLFWISVTVGSPSPDSGVAETPRNQEQLTPLTDWVDAGECRSVQKIVGANADSQASVPAHLYYSLARCYFKENRWSEAEAALEQFLKLAPQAPQGLLLKGQVLFGAGRYEESATILESYLQRDPRNAGARRLLGFDLFLSGRGQQAEAELKRTTEIAPSDAEAFYYLGRIYFSRNNLVAALEAFKKVIELDPGSVRGHNHLGQTYEGLAQFSLAQVAYLKAIELEHQQVTRSEWPYFNLALLYLKEGKLEEAAAYFREALARNPAWPEGKARLAQALAMLGNENEALSLLNQAIQLDPKNREVRYRLAQLLTKLGKKEEAEQQYLLLQQAN